MFNRFKRLQKVLSLEKSDFKRVRILVEIFNAVDINF